MCQQAGIGHYHETLAEALQGVELEFSGLDIQFNSEYRCRSTARPTGRGPQLHSCLCRVQPYDVSGRYKCWCARKSKLSIYLRNEVDVLA